VIKLSVDAKRSQMMAFREFDESDSMKEEFKGCNAHNNHEGCGYLNLIMEKESAYGFLYRCDKHMNAFHLDWKKEKNLL
jgi:hypothetical protein